MSYKNAVAYARYSTDKQTENSIEYQIQEISKYCDINNITLTDKYIDEGLSGTNTNRPGFQLLLKDAEAHKFDSVVIYDISRGSRNLVDWFTFRQEMKRLNIKVISCSQQLGEIDDPNNFLIETISVSLGQYQVLDTRKKSIAGSKTRALKGKFMGGYPPLGYDIINDEYVINNAEAAVVKQIFDMFIQGESYKSILEYVNKKGIQGKRGRPLGKNSIYSILKNVKYTGTYVYNEHTFWYMRKYCGRKDNPDKVIIEDCIPAIIDKQTFEMAQKRMEKRMKGKEPQKRTYLLSGLIKCPVCGAAYVGRCSTNKKGHETRYYTCGNKYRTRKCTSKNINAELLERNILNYITENFLNNSIDSMIDEIYEAYKKRTTDLSEEKKEYAKVKKEIDNIVNAIKKGIIFDELEDEIARLKLRESELKELISSKSKLTITRDEIAKNFENVKELNSKKDYYSLIHSFVESIIPNHDFTSIKVIIGYVGNDSCGGRI